MEDSDLVHIFEQVIDSKGGGASGAYRSYVVKHSCVKQQSR